MRNLYLDNRTARDIDQSIERVHKGLNDPNEKIDLLEVRDLLNLDMGYYTSEDTDLLDEIVHKIRVGAKQILKRPALLLDAVRSFDLRALYLPDRKRILIDAALPDLKKRWSESHEIAHSLIPWHSEYMLGDNRTTLSPSCHERIEAEANYGSGKLLFPPNAFSELCRSYPPTIASVKAIAKHFGNTITSTLWRYVEESDGVMFGIVGEHPHHIKDGEPEVAYFIRSRMFELQFKNVTEEHLFELIKNYSSYRKSGPLGSNKVILLDDNGNQQIFSMETFSNSHQALTLGIFAGPHSIAIAT